MKTCAVSDCPDPQDSHGYCSKHAHRFRRYGDPLGSASNRRGFNGRPDEERFWSFVEKTETCWLFERGITPDGYGRFDLSRKSGEYRTKSVLAHRYSFELEHGREPIGELNHICYRRNCVRPSHLEEVTRQENLVHGNMVRQAERMAGQFVQDYLRATLAKLFQLSSK